MPKGVCAKCGELRRMRQAVYCKCQRDMGFQVLERYSSVRGLGSGRRLYVRTVFNKVAEFCNHPFSLRRGEFEDLLGWLGPRLKPQTYNAYVIAIRSFYRWQNGGEYPVFMRHIRLKRFRREDTVSQKILSEAEVRALILAADNPRDKAMIGVCWEGGFRIGELLSVTIGGCEKTRIGFDVKVTGKTGTRVMPIILTAPLLELWLYSHPAKNDMQSPLWTRRHGNRYASITPVGADHYIKRLAKRAGLQKNVHWHMLRHSQATFYARSNVNEEQMRKIFGWEKDSNMPSLYTHLTSRDVQETVLALRGIKKIERAVKPIDLEPRVCFKCGENNSFDADYCIKCGTVLDREKAEALIRQQQVLDALYDLVKDPKVLEDLKKKL